MIAVPVIARDGDLTIHQRLDQLWKKLLFSGTDQKDWRVHLDQESHLHLMSNENARWEISLFVGNLGARFMLPGEIEKQDTDGYVAWNGIPVVIHTMMKPTVRYVSLTEKSSPPAVVDYPRLVSVSYTIMSGRRFYLDDELTDPIWTEGIIE